MKKLNSRFAHLTNYSVNKKSKHFVAPTSDNNSDMEGSKWSLTALWRYLMQAEGKGTVKKCQNEVKRLITKTLIAAEGEIAPLVHRHLKSPGCCYELFGFDVFLDKALRPWLIEGEGRESGERSEPRSCIATQNRRLTPLLLLAPQSTSAPPLWALPLLTRRSRGRLWQTFFT